MQVNFLPSLPTLGTYLSNSAPCRSKYLPRYLPIYLPITLGM